MRKPLPSQESLKERFDYVDGWLVYRVSAGTRAKKGSRLGSLAKSERGNYLAATMNGERFYVHRLIWKWHHNTEPDFIDHINRDRTDNRIENLRESDARLNNWNTKRSVRSGLPPCVSVYAHGGYRVVIGFGKTYKYFGIFDTVDEAIIARDTALANYGSYP